ncbi:MAG: hypothetical protein IJR47_04805, partial [Clostridia bacterium]|nr:hypothetical protein [Clostridia bacterium]
MFGFVRPAERELTAEQLNTFKSYYCGVCKSIEKNYSRAATATLTYDCAFLAMLLDSVATEAAPSKKIRCGIKERTAAYNEIIDYCAAINVLLAYHKLEDDIKDSKSKKAKLAKAVLKGAYEKARLGNERIDGLIISNLDYLSILEEENCDEPEMVADV